MNLTGNTVFITGGGSGIGRGLAEAFQRRGNKVIISGRRKDALQETIAQNSGMESIELDVTDPGSIQSVATQLISKYPSLNVLINNAGIMSSDSVAKPIDDATVEKIVKTNLLGPIRMTSALLDHLKQQRNATVINVTSGLAFIPLALTATYSATKAAMHSFTLSQRYLLKGSSVRVLELAPPYVQTELMGKQQASDPRAMPLSSFIDETMNILATEDDEILVDQAKGLRENAGPREAAFVTQFNDRMKFE